MCSLDGWTRFHCDEGIRSTHFHAGNVAERAAWVAGGIGKREGVAPATRAFNGAGECPPHTTPLIRNYNGGRGGAPDHRINAHLAAQWSLTHQMCYVREGFGPQYIVGCVE